MAFDQTTRNRLQSFVNKARAILSEEFTRQLQATYGLDPKQGTIADIESLSHLDNYQLQTAHILRETVQHYMTTTAGKTQKEQVKLVLERIVREQAFTVLNRLAALRMAEARGFLLESIGSGYSSQGFQLYQMLEDGSHGETGDAYQSYLFSLFDEFGLDLAVLFDRFSVQGRLFPRETALLQLLEQINDYEIEPLWAEDETIGWIYQYFNSQEERKKMRSESSAPRNSRELAVRNQFFTPRYVVEFLTDNTLGRIWYEMTKGDTELVDSCQYLVKRPNEVFLSQGENSPIQNESSLDENLEALTQEEVLKQPVYIPSRPLKDPRTIRMLDPACGSMHFGLYAFDLFEHIYLEAWQIEAEQGADIFEREIGLQSLQSTYGDLDSFKKQIPKLIIEYNIYGVDIDPRAVQIAGLSLWQRAQRAWHEQGVKPNQRPTIVKSNIVCAEPMPGEQDLLKEFTSTLNPPALGQLVEVIFEKMALAGEAGTLLKIEQEIESAISKARQQWDKTKDVNGGIRDLFEEELLAATPQQELGFDLSGIDDETFWEDAEQLILQSLKDYSEQATSAAGEKRLFAEDAAKGFAFIDLSRKRFDVVLMNPPFGEFSGLSGSYIRNNYPNHSNNIISPFISRAGNLLCDKGRSAAIFDKTISIKSSYSKIRQEYLFGKFPLVISSDLGWGVLDQAQVETVVNVFAKEKDVFEVENVLIDATNHKATIQNSFSLHSLDKIPNYALTLDVPTDILSIFGKYEAFEPACSLVRQGLGVSNSWRWYRTKAEVPIGSIGKERDYVWLANGGGMSPFFRDTDLTIYWRDNGFAIKQAEAAIYGSSSRTVKNVSFYFNEGISFPKRTEILNAHILPENHIFTVEGLGCFPDNGINVWHILALLNSRLMGYLINTFCGQHKHVGYIKQLPFSNNNEQELKSLAEESFNVKNIVSEYFVNTVRFKGPALLFANELLERLELNLSLKSSLVERLEQVVEALEECDKKLLNNTKKIDDLVFDAYSINDKSIVYIQESVSKNDISVLQGIIKYKDIRNHLVMDLLEYMLGLIFGYYTLKLENKVHDSQSKHLEYETLVSNPSVEGIVEVDIKVGNSAISKIVLDIESYFNLRHEEISSILYRVFDCQTVSTLFVDTKFFFDSHLGTFSKSRRQTPIYWPLQTSSGSYTLWLYYHHLNSQTLYSCINDFVEPKLTLVTEDLNTLSNRSNRSSTEEKELTKLTDLQNELKDFRDELLRLAKIWKPNLNDGVQITAAPLWKLFQHTTWQKKLKETWEKLEEGEYDWAHLAASIWPDRVLRKCHQDRSLAIAHDVEDVFWQEVEVPTMRGKKPTGKTKLEWQPIPASETTLNDMVNEAKARLQ